MTFDGIRLEKFTTTNESNWLISKIKKKEKIMLTISHKPKQPLYFVGSEEKIMRLGRRDKKPVNIQKF
jgi:hypothetical protein